MNNDLISRKALKKAIMELEKEPDYQHEGENWYCGLCMAETLIDNASPIPLLEISKIKEITERALRSEDPINLYKARALDDIAEILGIEIKEPEIAKRLVIKQDEDLSNPMMTAYRGYITFYEEG